MNMRSSTWQVLQDRSDDQVHGQEGGKHATNQRALATVFFLRYSTARHMSTPLEKTLILIKPDALQHGDDILARAYASGFSLIAVCCEEVCLNM
jgi:hypothetical protein